MRPNYDLYRKRNNYLSAIQNQRKEHPLLNTLNTRPEPDSYNSRNYQTSRYDNTPRQSLPSSKFIQNDQCQFDKQNCNYQQFKVEKKGSNFPTPTKISSKSPRRYDAKLQRPQCSSKILRSTTKKSNNQDLYQYHENLRLDMRESIGTNRNQQRIRSLFFYQNSQVAQNQNNNEYATRQPRQRILQLKQNKRFLPNKDCRNNQDDISKLHIDSSNPYVSRNVTPRKPVLQVGELVQKSQLLKQKIDRIGRMTPRGLSRRNQLFTKDTTPQKYSTDNFNKKQQIRQKQKSQNNEQEDQIPLISANSGQILKHNKYCDQKLPLQTIYDVDQHKLEQNKLKFKHEVEDRNTSDDAIQKISKLSRKINQRLKNIINKHGQY